MSAEIKKKLEQLKTNLVGIESILELHNSLTDRRLVNTEEVEETKLRIKYSREQMIDLAVRNKKILVSLEKEEMP
jgi:hypothetical protein